MTEVRLDCITHTYGTTPVLQDLSYTFPAGARTAILGPSGTGKSTILRIIAGLTTPSAGTVWFDNEDVSRTPPHRRHLGLMFQQYALWPHLDVAAHIGFGLAAAKQSTAHIRQRVTEVLELLGLQGLEHRRPHELSGGQQQRVALGRAIAPSPRVLLLDEPFAHLEPSLRLDLLRSLEVVHDHTKSTLIMVTHDTHEALSLAQSLLVLGRGKIEAAGQPEQIFRYPPSLAAARAVGEFNELVGTLTKDSHSNFVFKSTAITHAFAPDALAKQLSRHADDAPISLLFSPRLIASITNPSESCGPDKLCLTGKVIRNDFLGGIRRILVVLTDNATEITCEVPSTCDTLPLHSVIRVAVAYEAITIVPHR